MSTPLMGTQGREKMLEANLKETRGQDSQTGQGQGSDHTQGMESGLGMDLPTASQDSSGQPRVRGGSCRGQSTCRPAGQEHCTHTVWPEPP